MVGGGIVNVGVPPTGLVSGPGLLAVHLGSVIFVGSQKPVVTHGSLRFYLLGVKVKLAHPGKYPVRRYDFGLAGSYKGKPVMYVLP